MEGHAFKQRHRVTKDRRTVGTDPFAIKAYRIAAREPKERKRQTMGISRLDRVASLHHDAEMRTTISLDDDLYAIASSIAKDQHKPLSAVVNALLREGLNSGGNRKNRRSRFPSFRTRRKVTSEDVRALEDEM
jgi:Arc/MetJ family transcription regulator